MLDGPLSESSWHPMSVTSMKHGALFVVVFLGLWTPPLAGQLTERLYREACEGGSALECNLLGIMYEIGDGVTQDLGQAATLFQQACDGEIMQSCYRIGVMYANGTGVTQDLGQAVGFFQQACDGGETQSCSQLDLLFRLMTVAVLEQLPLDDRALTIGVDASGTLTEADPEVQAGQYTQVWALELSAGQTVSVSATSADFDSYLWVTGPGLDSGLDDDDSGGGCDARITFTAPVDGQYRASINTAVPGETGDFVLRASDTPPVTNSGSCSRALARVPQPLPPAIEGRMYAAVLEHVLESDLIEEGEPVAAICVGLGATGEEPVSPDILSLLSEREPPVVASTGCVRSIDAATSFPVIRATDGGPGIFLTIVEAPVGREANGFTGTVVLHVERDGVEPQTLRCGVETEAPRGVQRRAVGGVGGGRGGGGAPPAGSRTQGARNLPNLTWRISGC